MTETRTPGAEHYALGWCGVSVHRVTVRLYLCLIKHHDMKTYGGRDDTAALILTSALDGAGWAPKPGWTLCSCRSVVGLSSATYGRPTRNIISVHFVTARKTRDATKCRQLSATLPKRTKGQLLVLICRVSCRSHCPTATKHTKCPTTVAFRHLLKSSTVVGRWHPCFGGTYCEK